VRTPLCLVFRKNRSFGFKILMKKFIKIKKPLDIKGFSLYQPCGCFMVRRKGFEPMTDQFLAFAKRGICICNFIYKE